LIRNAAQPAVFTPIHRTRSPDAARRAESGDRMHPERRNPGICKLAFIAPGFRYASSGLRYYDYLTPAQDP